MEHRLADTARVRQVVEPGADGDANSPEDPVENRTNRVAPEMGLGTNQGELRKWAEGDRPVTNLIAE